MPVLTLSCRVSALFAIVGAAAAFAPASQFATQSRLQGTASRACVIRLDEAPAPPEVASDTDVRLEDRGVPEAHAGLHSQLYGSGEDHGAAEEKAQVLTFDGTSDLPIEEVLSKLQDAPKVAGVYAVADADGRVRFVGLSRHLLLSLNAHAAKVPELISRVRILSFGFPQRSVMEEAKKAWIQELGYKPDGNGDNSQLWADSIRTALAVTPDAAAEERQAYETQKLQLRRAMADSTLVDAPASDDWTAAVSEQNMQTASAAAPTSPAVTSPFADAAAAAPEVGAGLELNAANVDKVLEEVRPYLIADGGNVEVARIDTESRSVYLRLQGACGSCPSATVTMKMGIERVLREQFVDIGEVAAVDDAPTEDGSRAELNEDVVLDTLSQILPAIRGLGGSVEVASAKDGLVQLRYKGPPKIQYGIELALRDNPLIKDVQFVDVESS